ncbi:hypothetical protein [Aquicella lusitana]|uniref:Uncharacterized protein n=1 Tax=Aquicella lusitana TaxID=254246 RepID=A0A370GMC4_9COXI|nr:hypothetical protein [Aquicella lusitana]RDI44520.1 hypothetical protein C8D86_1092 [Aquicella lusitana]VVC72538.1 hypothetical protein AQULUS_02500 [Aquicella lusitana]
MNRYTWNLLLCVCISVLTACAQTTDPDKVPSLESFHTSDLPTGSSDAAMTAAKTY